MVEGRADNEEAGGMGKSGWGEADEFHIGAIIFEVDRNMSVVILVWVMIMDVHLRVKVQKKGKKNWSKAGKDVLILD